MTNDLLDEIKFSRVDVRFNIDDETFKNTISNIISYRANRLKFIIAMMEENITNMCLNKFETEEERIKNLKITSALLDQISSIIRNNIEDTSVIIYKMRYKISENDTPYIY